MATHDHHPGPADRPEFLVDGCDRCREYVDDLGLHFDEARYRAFFAKMVDVEFDSSSRWASKSDAVLGRRLYYVALTLQRAYGIDPRMIVRLGAAAFHPTLVITYPDPEVT